MILRNPNGLASPQSQEWGILFCVSCLVYSVKSDRSMQEIILKLIKIKSSWAEMAHSFNSSIQYTEAGDLCAFEASLGLSSRTARYTKRNLVSKTK